MSKCLVCDHHAPEASLWCSTRCRLLLRDEGRVRYPGITDRAMWPQAIAWARTVRVAGRKGALTQRVSDKLAKIPTTGSS